MELVELIRERPLPDDPRLRLADDDLKADVNQLRREFRAWLVARDDSDAVSGDQLESHQFLGALVEAENLSHGSLFLPDEQRRWRLNEAAERLGWSVASFSGLLAWWQRARTKI